MVDPDVPIKVAQSGISLGSALTAAGVWTGIFTFLGIMWKNKVPMKKLGIDAEERLREDLMNQLNAKDSAAQGRYDALEKRLEAMRARYEARLETERVSHAAEMQIMRHRMNNLDQCLSMMLVMTEENPEKAKNIAARVREMRERQEVLENEEKARIAAARLSGANVEDQLTHG